MTQHRTPLPAWSMLFILTTNLLLSVASSGHRYKLGWADYVINALDKKSDYSIAALGEKCGRTNLTSREARYMPQAYQCEDGENRHGIDRRHSWSRSWSRQRPVSRLIGGFEPMASDFPSYALLSFKENVENEDKEPKRWRCSGVLIHDNLILTVTHCLDREFYQAGSVRVTFPLSGKKKVHKAEAYCKMEGFARTKTGPKNDVAVIRLADTVDHPVACLDFAKKPKSSAICATVAEGPRRHDNAEASDDNEIRALFMQQICNSDTNMKWGGPDRSCYQRANISRAPVENPRQYNGNLCENDGGAPIYCMDHCEFGPPKVYLAGIASFVISKTVEDLKCDGDNTDKPLPTMVMDFFKLRTKFHDLFKACFKRADRTGEHWMRFAN